MNYKTIALLALLLPVASYAQSKQARIEELEKVQLQKELELSGIGKMISERDEILLSYNEYAAEILLVLEYQKVAEIEMSNGGKKLSGEEKKELSRAMLNSANNFMDSVCSTCKGDNNIENFLVEGLFIEKVKGVKTLESLKFFLVRCAFERNLMVLLVKKYEKCIQETMKIGLEIAQLNK